MMAQHTAGITMLDYSEETSSTKINVGAITAASLPGFLANFGDWKNAVGNIALGTLARDRWVGDATTISNTPPVNPNAQIELKWFVGYEGDTSKKKFHIEVPTADPSKVVPGTDRADLTDTDIAAFITATETMGRSPDDDTETISVTDMRLVGRNI
jgi:hypothetical protein